MRPVRSWPGRPPRLSPQHSERILQKVAKNAKWRLRQESNVTDFSSIFAADIEAVKGDYPGTLVWNGQSIAGTMSPLLRSAESVMEGFHGDYERTFVAKLALFTGSTPPEAKDDAVIDGVTFFVVDRVVDLGVVTLRLKRR